MLPFCLLVHCSNLTSGPAAQLHSNAAGQLQPQEHEATPGFMEVACWVEERDSFASKREI